MFEFIEIVSLVEVSDPLLAIPAPQLPGIPSAQLPKGGVSTMFPEIVFWLELNIEPL